MTLTTYNSADKYFRHISCGQDVINDVGVRDYSMLKCLVITISKQVPSNLEQIPPHNCTTSELITEICGRDASSDRDRMI